MGPDMLEVGKIAIAFVFIVMLFFVLIASMIMERYYYRKINSDSINDEKLDSIDESVE